MQRSENNENRDISSPALLSTKVCHIVKRSDFEGYGFNLHSERVKPGQYVGKVDMNSPAETAGLKEGYRIIEVNGVNISQESHKQVVQRIKAISHEVRLLIVDVNANKDITAAKSVLTNLTTSLQKSSNDNNISKVLQDTQLEKPRSSINVSVDMRKPSTIDDASTILKHNNDATVDNSNAMRLGKHDDTRSQSSTKDSTAVSVGALELPMTAAEMRAKLLSKKKYDPKNEIVDLKKKFEIIQKL
ncbi:Na(+)/H(+) exchange regulatory cofactor NHE-RF1 [Zeugodacus cucurbitae]|uniref:Na(+)/H(+) exchange regulatory cofactor NHE-RF2 n=1 Tax=Zeugodacus cucurbitae TaxID=28588 RepID=A0A0A1WT81_ZEUCU|nr:Na(+)/H(+) exchange regulatory cofactor NHE-RF1 [Zeugodacus cucurbitae]XP_054091333.1 Na(+)/H(+) exchange regulatory cofactor NHE-RF1 [Zeugodacus cucurbitae]